MKTLRAKETRPKSTPPSANAAQKAGPNSGAAAPGKQPIVRVIAPGAKIGPETLVICNVDIRSVKTEGNKNRQRAAGYPKPGEPPKMLAACIKDGITKGDALYDFVRGWVDLDPAPETHASRK
jgi:hypothetical protein